MLHIAALLLLLGFCQAQVITGPDFFTAAVFEHRHRGDNTTDTPQEFIRKNLDFYEKAAEVASQKGTDIIVFSEYGLFPYINDRKILRHYFEQVPDPHKGNWNPCNNQDLFRERHILVTLSCLAQKHKMVVVANMGDLQPCEVQTCDIDDIENCEMNDVKCPTDDIFLYNTDVAFDREGTLIARYHKVHPYFEVVNVPHIAEYSIFKTDFGIFGMIVCFDCIFKESVKLVDEYGIETLLFPTYWFDDISPLKAIELQQAWSLTNRVNFLAANGHNPVLGTLGSGIYSKDLGALTYTYNPDGHSKLLIAKVPRKEGIGKPPLTDEETEVIIISEKGVTVEDEDGDSFPEQCYNIITEPPKDELRDYRCYKSQTAKYALSKLKNPSGELEVCNNGMCCSVKYSASSMEEDYYLAVFNGTNDVKDFYFWCEETCLLVRCDPLENKPCVTLPAKSKTVFQSVEMKASFTTQHVYPAVSKHNNRLAPKAEWNITILENSAVLQYQSTSNKPLLKVGLLGRCYGRDPPFKPFF